MRSGKMLKKDKKNQVLYGFCIFIVSIYFIHSYYIFRSNENRSAKMHKEVMEWQKEVKEGQRQASEERRQILENQKKHEQKHHKK